MHKLIHKISIGSGLIAALFAGLIYAGEGEGGDKPYTVKDGKVDKNTYIGWRTFNGNCARCHGETAAGSTFAPSLFQRMEGMPEVVFMQVVKNGMKGEVGVMPAFGNDGNVTPYLDELWAYLSALTAEAIPPGRPDVFGEKEEVPEYLRKK